jgi:hypothetical protein
MVGVYGRPSTPGGFERRLNRFRLRGRSSSDLRSGRWSQIPLHRLRASDPSSRRDPGQQGFANPKDRRFERKKSCLQQGLCRPLARNQRLGQRIADAFYDLKLIPNKVSVQCAAPR